MSRRTKIWLILATGLVLIGCVVFIGVVAELNWDFTKLSTAKYDTTEYEIHEDYKNISVVTDSADIVFLPSENRESAVVCYEQQQARHAVAVKDGTLVIEIVDTRKWYEYIGIHFGTPKITVSIPQGEYGTLYVKSDTGDVEIQKEFKFDRMDISESTGDVLNYASASADIKIKTSTGDIQVETISAGALDLSVSTGEIVVSNVTCEGDITATVSTGKTKLTDITCKRIISGGDTGDMILQNVIATEAFSMERSTGDIRFDGCDAAEIFVKTDTGDVAGCLLTDKVYIVQSDTGRVDVPQTGTGGKCEITTSTGDINIRIQ